MKDFEYKVRPILHDEEAEPSLILRRLRHYFSFWLTMFQIHYMFYPMFIFLLFTYGIMHGYGYYIIPLILLYIANFISKEPSNLGRPWHAFRKHRIWMAISEYFGVHVIRQQELDPAKKYVFACHPHGILILSRFVTLGGIVETIFPGVEWRVLCASAQFYLPISREICMWCGGVDASRESADRVLSKGISVIVYPGGTKEIFNTNPATNKTRLVLKSRKGFVKLAIKHGAAIVPMFTFGEKWMYNIYRPPRWMWKTILKLFKVPLVLFWGQFGTWMPLRKSLGVVYGKPIEVEQCDEPTMEQVDKVHQEFITATRGLFDQYASKFGYESKEVLIIE